jgi:hypothetical protein
MRRFRLSTLTLLIVIAALSMALVVQHRRAARREAELRARLAAAAMPGSQYWNVNVRGMEGRFDIWSHSISGKY